MQTHDATVEPKRAERTECKQAEGTEMDWSVAEFRRALQQSQALVRTFISADRLLSEELIAERRVEALSEQPQ